MSVLHRWEEVRNRIARAAARAGRRPDEIAVLAVTKTHPFDTVAPLLEAGISGVGENRVQEALQKFQSPGGCRKINLPIHLIGPLQTNKAKKAVAFFDVIESVDRLDLARDLQRHAQAISKVQECLIELKVSDEATKSGLDPAVLPDFLDALKAFPNLRIRGLMGIPPLSATGEAARPYFQRLRNLFEDCRSKVQGPKSKVNDLSLLADRPGTWDLGPWTAFNILSMGMSSDFEVAIEEGATLLRLGTVLFGARPRV